MTLARDTIGDALDVLIEGTLIQSHKYNGNSIGVQLPMFVELAVAYTEPGVRGDSSSLSVTKSARLETGLEFRFHFSLKKGRRSGFERKPVICGARMKLASSRPLLSKAALELSLRSRQRSVTSHEPT